jgi:hypothetical protein
VEDLVCVTPPLGSTRHVIEVIDTLDVEGDVVGAFDKSQIAPPILDFG